MRKGVHNFNKKYEIDPNTGCWNWTRSKDKDGYGKITTNGKCLRAHRFSWILYRGNIPDNLIIRHKCDNPACVNPDHLELGTSYDNIQDRVTRNRGAVGINNGSAKLNTEDVKTIKRLLTRGYNSVEIAKRFGFISESTILAIKHGKIWNVVE